MSEDYEREQVMLIDGFKGKNILHGNSKIGPNEFEDSIGNTTENGVINNRYYIGQLLEIAPHPYVADCVWTVDNLSSAAGTVEDVPIGESFLVRVQAESDIAEHEPITIFLGLTFPDRSITSMHGCLYSDNAGNIGSNIALSPVEQYHGITGTETKLITNWRAFTIFTTVAIPVGHWYWIGFKNDSGEDGIQKILTSDDASGRTWRNDANGAISTVKNPVHFVVRSKKCGGHHPEYMETFDIPGGDKKITDSNLNHGIPGNYFPVGGIIYVPTEAGDNCAIIKSQSHISQCMTFSSTDVYYVSQMTIAYKGGIAYITHPKTKYCVPLSLSKTRYGSYLVHDTFNAQVSNGILVLNTWGAIQNSGHPCYIDLQRAVTRIAPMENTREYACSMGVFKDSFFFRGSKQQWAQETYTIEYTAAGMVNTYGGEECISNGVAVYAHQVYNGRLYFFTEDNVSELSGVFGNAILRTIYSDGTTVKRGVVSTPYGMFMLARSGLHVFRGTWRKLVDLLDIKSYFDSSLKNILASTQAFLYYSENTRELFFKPAAGIHHIFTYNPMTNVYGAAHTAASDKIVGQIGFLNSKMLVTDRDKAIDAIKTLPEELNITPQYCTVKTGWINPNPEYVTKIIERIVIEGTGPISPDEMTLNVILNTDLHQKIVDNTFTYTSTPAGVHSVEKINFITIPVGAECNMFQLQCTNVPPGKFTIQSIKIYYSLGRVK